MKPKRKNETGQTGLLGMMELQSGLDQRHELYRLADAIDWNEIQMVPSHKRQSNEVRSNIQLACAAYNYKKRMRDLLFILKSWLARLGISNPSSMVCRSYRAI